MAIKYKKTAWGKGRYSESTGKWVSGKGKKNSKGKNNGN